MTPHSRLRGKKQGAQHEAAHAGPPAAPATSADTPSTTVVTMRLYIAGGGPNSVQAVANLLAICHEHLTGGHQLEIIDILEHPLRAMTDGVLVTPSLSKLSPLPMAQILGNLNDRPKVLLALGLA